MENDHSTHRPNSDKFFDPPVLLQRERHSDHSSGHSKTEHKAPLELPQYPADGNKETNAFTFLGRGTPFERPAEEVSEESLRNVQGDAAEKDGEERDPLHVCPEATENVFLFDAMTKDGEGNVAEDTEDDHNGEVY